MVLDVKRIEVPSSLSEIAYEAIKESLLKMDLSELDVEDRVDERALAEKVGVSRTPLIAGTGNHG